LKEKAKGGQNSRIDIRRRDGSFRGDTASTKKNGNYGRKGNGIRERGGGGRARLGGGWERKKASKCRKDSDHALMKGQAVYRCRIKPEGLINNRGKDRRAKALGIKMERKGKRNGRWIKGGTGVQKAGRKECQTKKSV